METVFPRSRCTHSGRRSKAQEGDPLSPRFHLEGPKKRDRTRYPRRCLLHVGYRRLYALRSRRTHPTLHPAQRIFVVPSERSMRDAIAPGRRRKKHGSGIKFTVLFFFQPMALDVTSRPFQGGLDSFVNPTVIGNFIRRRQSEGSGVHQLTYRMSGLQLLYTCDSTGRMEIRLPQEPVFGACFHIWLETDFPYSGNPVTPGTFLAITTKASAPVVIWGMNNDLVPALPNRALVCSSGKNGDQITILGAGNSWSVTSMRGTWAPVSGLGTWE
jgi:hypothetical protein